jgi:hypothetical protein
MREVLPHRGFPVREAGNIGLQPREELGRSHAIGEESRMGLSELGELRQAST